jgi:hypothetical protein
VKPQSAKSKGRSFQQYVVAKILKTFPELKDKDVISRAMGSPGDDIMLSPKATELFPVSIECKSRKQMAIYADYRQAESNADGNEPILIIKQNHSKPLAVMDLDIFLILSRRMMEKHL